MKKRTFLCNFFYDCRWYLGLFVFILAVLLQLHGSSIGMWKKYMIDRDHKDLGLVFGEDRSIRTDEWDIFTPMALSQYYNDFGLTSNLPRATETDMFLIYGQPVRDWSMIFRPFQIGYLFLSPAQGLSFYWGGKLIALLLVSLDFGMLITRRKKLLSLAYACAVAFAPITQWWFSINSFPDMLIYGQGIVLCLHHYMRASSYKKRMLCALGLYILCGAYLLVLYPAWQIPFFYTFAAVGVWAILTRWKRFSFRWKMDLPILGFAVLLLTLSMYIIFSRSRDALQAILGASYPGVRRETGGIGLQAMLQYAGNIFFPFAEQKLAENTCGLAMFYDLFPCGLLLSAFALLRGKRKDSLTWLLYAVLALVGIFSVFGSPTIVSRLTLLSQSPPSRSVVAVSYISLLLLFRGLSNLQKAEIRIKPVLALALSLVFGFCIAWLSARSVYSAFYMPWMLWVSAAVLIVLVAAALLHTRLFSIALIALSLVIGGLVNPLRTGLGVIENHTLGQAIKAIAAQDDGAWLVMGRDWVADCFPLMYGAKTVNCTNTYVNQALWDRLDPAGEYRDIYNRYGHMTVRLTQTEATRVELLYPDSFLVTLNTQDLPKLNAKYVLSNHDLTEYNDANLQFEEIYSSPAVQYRIYQLHMPET